GRCLPRLAERPGHPPELVAVPGSRGACPARGCRGRSAPGLGPLAAAARGHRLGDPGPRTGLVGARPGNPGCRRSGIRSRRPPAAHAGLRLDHRVPGMAAAAGRLPRHAAAPAGRTRHRPGAAGGGRVERSVSGWTEWPAPAKLNLFLRITGRRPDGYHELQTVFRILDGGDTIRLRVREDGQVVRHGTSAPGVAEADDLTVRAAKLLQSHANCASGAD